MGGGGGSGIREVRIYGGESGRGKGDSEGKGGGGKKVDTRADIHPVIIFFVVLLPP